MTQFYLYRRGDGNEGNFPRQCVALNDDDCPYAALRALVLNEWKPGSSMRRYIAKHLQVDGERNQPSAEVYQGPRGIMAYDACWLTAELQPMSDEYVSGRAGYYNGEYVPIRDLLDNGAKRMLRSVND